MSINVLVISNYRDYHTARPEASIFKGLAKIGFNVHVMTYMDSKHVPEFEAAGIKVVDFHPQKKFDKAEIKRIRQYLIEHKIDIVHLFNNASIVNGIKAAKGLKTKVVLYRGYTGNISWYDPTAYLKFLHPRVDKIFCNSIGVKKYIDGQLFSNKSKTITINKGHDIEWYNNYPPHDIKSELGINQETFLLVTVANNRRMKGVPYLMKAMAMLKPDGKIKLLLAGRGMDTKENLAILDKTNSRDKVHFLGFRKDVLNIVAACDVFVLPSIKGESITKSVIESMSLETPAIITDIPGNVELVDDGINGWVVPSKDPKALAQAIENTYTNRDNLSKIGQEARLKIMNKLNYQQTIEKTAEMYKNLIKE